MYFVIKQQEDGSFFFPSGNGTQKYTIYETLSEATDMAQEYGRKYGARYIVFKAILAAQPVTPPIELISL